MGNGGAPRKPSQAQGHEGELPWLLRPRNWGASIPPSTQTLFLIWHVQSTTPPARVLGCGEACRCCACSSTRAPTATLVGRGASRACGIAAVAVEMVCRFASLPGGCGCHPKAAKR